MSDFVPTEHPVLKLPTRREVERWLLERGEEAVRRWFEEREEVIRAEREDPFRCGMVLEAWKAVDEVWRESQDVLILGGNRSSKSEYAAHTVMGVLVEKPGARVWCFQSTNDNSVEMQQPYVYKYLPREWKELKRGRVQNVTYSVKGGFTEGTFVLPNASQCWFRSYADDIKTIEGGELDLIWCDELVPASWLETLRYRLVTRGGRLLITFTPIQGYSATVKMYLQGAKTVRDREAELLPVEREGRVVGYERVPLLQVQAMGNRRVAYFHSQDNPYGGYENLKRTLQGLPRKDVLCRAYGVPTRAAATRFPRFGDWNVVRADQVPRRGTRVMVADPAGGRNYFMIWAVFDPANQCFIYREWPGHYYVPGWGVPGEWALPSEKHDGERGPAQIPQGWGLERYREEIERLERRRVCLPEGPESGAKRGALGDYERPGWRKRHPEAAPEVASEGPADGPDRGEVMLERFMDARAAGTGTVRRDRTVTLLEEWEEVGLVFTPVTGRGGDGRDAIDEGVHQVNDWLDWNVDEPMCSTNRPRLYVSEKCRNVIYALKEWTGLDGRHGACKDPVDLVRYLVQSGAGYVSERDMRPRGGGHW